ncbi:hypothetical protein [Olleya sp. Bg11-27]|uniref:hypothetical protein n=1 Tax=Olleya sp. Bg11-27 TaxID=2058135 RepID=UPI000C31A102|nr:hypothetical protein [Olleya sp. Bg11-27]AUC75259.1 hypothetical protein CW732_06055 [Olleya sp. Bg11-27]
MKTNLKLLTVFVVLISLFSCQNEPIGGLDINAEDTIAVHSELYNNLARITDNPEEELPVTCVDFNYPITMYTFDTELQLLATTLIQNDALFLTYLNNLEDDYSISISYPITTQLEDGTTFSINNNQELKENIEACIEEVEAIEAQNCLFLINNCVWKVGYTRNIDNTYLGAVFNEDNGSTAFTHDDQLLFGSWTTVFIEGELHLNISLNNSGIVGDYFNYDWKVDYLDSNSIQLTHEDQSFVIHQYCDNDYALCTNFAFEKCELEDTPGVAEFTFDNYTFCITNILQIDSATTNLIYFETEEDAVNNTNAIASDQVYLNISQFQNVYIRVENLMDDTSYTISILIIAQPC